MSTRRILLFASSVAAMCTAAVALLLFAPSPLALGAASPAGDVKLKITGTTIPSDLKPVVTFSLTDSNGNPLKLTDADSNGIRFTLASIQSDPDTNNTKYVNYVVNNVAGKPYQFGGATKQPAVANATQAAMDSGGTFADLGQGQFTYTFKATAPTDFNPQNTHAVGGTATRGNRASVSNDVFYFVPAGSAPQTQREVVATANCNACHDTLAAHGGTRRDTRLCVLCHTAQSTDVSSGNTVDFKVMVHKIHSGDELPSVKAGTPYFIGSGSHDFSDVAFPQDRRNCQTCHKVAPQAGNFKTQPSAEACGSCHDNVDFKTGANHPGGPQPSNASCSTCHKPDGQEFDLSVTGAHTLPEKSKQLRGVNFQIVSFTDTRPGQSPTVVFNIKDKAGQAIQPSEMASLSLVLAGPTFDYANAVSETATGAKPIDDGNFSYTFKASIPSDATGSYAVGIQGYLAAELKNSMGVTVKDAEGNTQIRDVGYNKIAYGAVTDATAMPRKQAVDVKNCNVCHETLEAHGGTRRNPEFCVMCHNPNNTDAAKRATANGPLPPQPISFDWLIHKLHTGEDSHNKPFVIYGGPASNIQPVDLSEVRYPTDRRNCAKCHTPQANLMDFIHQGAQPITVKVGGAVVSQTGPIQAACMSCHDSAPARDHAQLNTTESGGESCLVCHAEDRDFPVSKAHAS